MKTLIQDYKEKFQKTLESISSRIDLADYLLETNVTTLKELEDLQRQLSDMRTQVMIDSGVYDSDIKEDIIFRIDSKQEFLTILIHNLKERSV